MCEVSGWGDTDPSSDRVFRFATQLQSGNVSLHDFDDCAEKYAKSKHLKLFEEKVHLCAYDEKVDAFIGDSGGPLVCFDVRIRPWKSLNAFELNILETQLCVPHWNRQLW